MSNEVFIYALEDPRDGAIRYVGKTKAMKNRLLSHCIKPHSEALRRWVGELYEDGRIPRAVTLEEVEEPLSAERERYWIREYQTRGAVLLNANGLVQPPRPCGATDRNPVFCHSQGMEEELLTTQEAAAFLGVGETAIRNAIHRERLAYVERYGRKLLRRADLLTYKANVRPGRPKKAQGETDTGAEGV